MKQPIFISTPRSPIHLTPSLSRPQETGLLGSEVPRGRATAAPCSSKHFFLLKVTVGVSRKMHREWC